MINLDNMKWYHKLWFVPFAVIGLIVQLPYAIVTAPFRKK